jgi:dihydrofolate synthase/folylpolyglutamate synthase
VNYPDSVQFLYALGNEIKTAKLGLNRITAVLNALGSPQDICRFVHVAGTNGKGSTCAMIERGLRASGRRTGLFTSPHLLEPTERIRMDGAAIGAGEFAEAFDRVHSAAVRLLDAGEIDLHPTYFETVTAMAMSVFAGRTDMVVLEVGLGGRLDATNVVTPELCVVTPVDYDHEAYLGTDIRSIAAEKAGILKSRVPAVFAPQRFQAAEVLEDRARSLGIDFVRVLDSAITDLALTREGSTFNLDGMELRCGLAGEHQVQNAATAAIALKQLGVTEAAIRIGLERVEWPGRLERVSEKPEIILDGAHNPAGARALAAYIQRFYSDRAVCLIFGAMRDKAVEEIAGALFPLAQNVILTAPQQARALAPEAIREAIEHPNLRLAAGIGEALELARGSDVVFVTGSLFLVAEARRLLKAGQEG